MMGTEVVLLEELVKHSDMMITFQVADVEVLSQTTRRIPGNCFEIRYELRAKKNVQPELAEEQDDEDIDFSQLKFDNISSYKEPIRYRGSHPFLPHERDILNNELFCGMITFNTNEKFTISKNAVFPSNIVKQCLGAEYDKTKVGDKISAFKILYNMNSKFCDGILIANENCNILSNMAKYTGINYGGIMGFSDHFCEKEYLNLECTGKNEFRIVYDKEDPILKNQVITVRGNANNDFYIGLELISQERNRVHIKPDKIIIPEKSIYSKRKMKYSEEEIQ